MRLYPFLYIISRTNVNVNVRRASCTSPLLFECTGRDIPRGTRIFFSDHREIPLHRSSVGGFHIKIVLKKSCLSLYIGEIEIGSPCHTSGKNTVKTNSSDPNYRRPKEFSRRMFQQKSLGESRTRRG